MERAFEINEKKRIIRQVENYAPTLDLAQGP
jgi:hypothetical protein